jgi:protein-S-isoprenylcysteine O-methyltransferase Ste14
MKLFFQALIPALWLAWFVFWLVAARGAKEVRREESAASRFRHYALFIAGGVILGKPHILGPALEQRFHAHTFGWYLAGLALIVAGLGFSVVARIWLGGNWSAAVTVKKDHELIRTGPYAVTRHPIYTGVLLALIGTAIVVGTWRALVALPVLLLAAVIKIGTEERFMAAEFGDDYARYRAEVKALVPFIV